MNQLYTLSKERYAQKLNDQEYKRARRQLLEIDYGYNKHLPSEVAQPIADQEQTRANPKLDSVDTPQPPVAPVQQVEQSTLKQQNTNVEGSNAALPSNKTNVVKYAGIGAAAVLIILIGSFFMGSDSEEVVNEPSEVAPVQQAELDLQKMFEDIVESEDYSSDSVDLFLSFWQLANEQQQKAFIDRIDNDILDLDVRTSEKLSAVKTRINRSSNDLVQHTNKIIAGELTNENFSFLSTLWQQATPSDKDVFVSFIISSYQNFIVDFENENEALAVEEIMNHLGILGLIQVSEYDVQAEVASVVEQSNDVPAAPTSTTVSEPSNIQKPVIKETNKQAVVVNQTPSNTSQTPQATVTQKVEAASTRESQTAVVQEVKTNSEQTSVPATIPSTQQANQVEETLNNAALALFQVLEKESLRDPNDATVLPLRARSYYQALQKRNIALGKSKEEARELAIAEYRDFISSHPSFAFHFHDIEQYNTDIGQGDVEVEFITADQISKLAKWFSRFERPPEP